MVLAEGLGDEDRQASRDEEGDRGAGAWSGSTPSLTMLRRSRPTSACTVGDDVNMQPFGGGPVPPRTIAAILSRLEAPLGRFAILGNHD